jgi:alpha-L-rhamnosidase
METQYRVSESEQEILNTRLSRRELIAATTAMLAGSLIPGQAAEKTVAPSHSGGVTVHDLRCEDLTYPLGLDEPAPRLSWIVRTDRRGWRQSAYQIRVASSAERLEGGHGDLWDSGNVASAKTSQIVYRGKPLAARQECFWQVRVWDTSGIGSAWSAVGHWEMGLLTEADWKGAAWIGGAAPAATDASAQDVPRTLDGSSWIWYPEPGGDPAVSAPEGTRWFRHAFSVPTDRHPRSARLLFSADDTYDVRLNGRKITAGGQLDDWRTLKSVDVMSQITPGRNVLAIAATNQKDAAGLICRLHVALDQGDPLEVVTDGTWKAFATEVAGWDTMDFDDQTWPAARVVAPYGGRPWGLLSDNAAPVVQPAPYLRRTFAARGPVRRARLSACGLGYADLFLNGHRIGGDRERDPAYTAFDKRALYVTHDVTALIATGQNALGAILGRGWYDVADLATWGFDKASWRGPQRLRLVLDVEYTDGSSETVVSDKAWKTATGPILRDGIYTGEIYDSRQELPGWDRAGYHDAAWKPAAALPSPGGKLAALRCPPIAVTQTLVPIAITEPKPGVFLADFGQNFSGHVRLKITAPAGTRITMRYGEKLHTDGTLDTSNIDYFMTKTTPPQPFQSDTYICKGGGEEEWEQRFSYSGFRYAEITGFPTRPTKDNLQGRFAHTDVESAGEFTCSDTMLNKIQHATRWSYLSNAQSIPTDCPQREKNGWTGDAQLAAETGLMNFRSAPFYTKWLDDLADNQHPDGRLGDIVPTGGWGLGGCNPAWDSAYPIIAWDLYRYVGDTRILERHVDRIGRYVDYVAGHTEAGVVPFGSLGDWVPWKTETPSELSSTVYLFRDAQILAQAGQMLGRKEITDKYAALAAKTKDAFNAKWLDPKTSTYANASQTAQAMPLFYDLVPDEHRAAAFAALVADLERQGHIDTGILGAKYVIRVLAQNGRSDLAYRIVTRKEQPSWAWWMEQGATTLWEDWKGEQSLNHIMFGDVSNWFFQWIAGIGLDSDSPGFGHVLIQPQPVGGLTWAKAQHDSPHGQIACDWQQDAGVFHLNVTIPANATATVWVPASDHTQVREGGHPVDRSQGVQFLRQEKDRAVFAIGSGAYAFTSPGR